MRNGHSRWRAWPRTMPSARRGSISRRSGSASPAIWAAAPSHASGRTPAIPRTGDGANAPDLQLARIDAEENEDDADDRRNPGERAHERHAEEIKRDIGDATPEEEFRTEQRARIVLAERVRHQHDRREQREGLDIVFPGAVGAAADLGRRRTSFVARAERPADAAWRSARQKDIENEMDQTERDREPEIAQFGRAEIEALHDLSPSMARISDPPAPSIIMPQRAHGP